MSDELKELQARYDALTKVSSIIRIQNENAALKARCLELESKQDLSHLQSKVALQEQIIGSLKTVLKDPKKEHFMTIIENSIDSLSVIIGCLKSDLATASKSRKEPPKESLSVSKKSLHDPITVPQEPPNEPVTVLQESLHEPVTVLQESLRDPITVPQEPPKEPISVLQESLHEPVTVPHESPNKSLSVLKEPFQELHEVLIKPQESIQLVPLSKPLPEEVFEKTIHGTKYLVSLDDSMTVYTLEGLAIGTLQKSKIIPF